METLFYQLFTFLINVSKLVSNFSLCRKIFINVCIILKTIGLVDIKEELQLWELWFASFLTFLNSFLCKMNLKLWIYKEKFKMARGRDLKRKHELNVDIESSTRDESDPQEVCIGKITWIYHIHCFWLANQIAIHILIPFYILIIQFCYR